MPTNGFGYDEARLLSSAHVLRELPQPRTLAVIVGQLPLPRVTMGAEQ
jgi:hypothetical protein